MNVQRNIAARLHNCCNGKGRSIPEIMFAAACITHAHYGHLWPVGSIVFFHIISKSHDFRLKKRVF
jgi:hypothetical protein